MASFLGLAAACNLETSLSGLPEAIELTRRQAETLDLAGEFMLLRCLKGSQDFDGFCTCRHRRRMIRNVQQNRSAEQWASLADTKSESTWIMRKKLWCSYNLMGKRYYYHNTGSMFDGWVESLLACCCPQHLDELHLGEDIMFFSQSIVLPKRRVKKSNRQ